MAALLSMIASAGLVLLVQAYWIRFSSLPQSRVPDRFRIWLAQGVGLPLIVVFIFNLGIIPGLAPVLNPIGGQRARAADLWSAYCVAAFVTITWWTAINLVWLIGVHLKRLRESRGGAMILACGLLALLPAAAMVWSMEWLGVGFAISLWLIPMAHAFLKVAPKVHIPPNYAAVIEGLRCGQIAEAEWEVLAQLEKSPDDFQGWLLLAEIYAECYRDMKLARETIFATCAQKNVTWAEVSIALHRLADWYTEIEQDTCSARRTLAEIHERMPETYLAQLAQQRMERLGREQAQHWQLPRCVDNPLDEAHDIRAKIGCCVGRLAG